MATNYRGGELLVTLLDRCRELRAESTDAESLLWLLLRNRRLQGVKFRRQHQFGPFVLDFYAPEGKLAIEADGGQHFEDARRRRDEARSRYLRARGIKVLRFTDREILLETTAVLESIWSTLADPHPNRLPEGEGIRPPEQ